MAHDTAPDTAGPVTDPQIEADRRLIVEARRKGFWTTLRAYTRLSGPGWLQSAITLGGGSLASSLYLGVLGGFALLWLQPVAMIIGIIMLSAIAYVTLSTGERPFRAISRHVNPVLAWGWLIATLLANCVWALPQFSLACGALRQNLMPETFAGMAPNVSSGLIAGSIAVFCTIMVYFYDRGGWGVKVFDIVLKVMVGSIVLSFFGVVVYMTGKGALDWSGILAGFVPNPTLLWSPAETFDTALAAVGAFRDFWADRIVDQQQDVLVAAAATAVGINMTFLLPYSMLKKGWNKDFRGMASFDLALGLFIPFVLATGCVVIASASRFHTEPAIPFPADDASGAIVKEARASDFAGLAPDERAERLQAIVRVAYTECLTDESKGTFPASATAAVAQTMNQAGFSSQDAAARRAGIKKALQEAAEGKTLPPDPKLYKDYHGMAVARLKADLGEGFDALSAEEVEEAVKALPLGDRRMAAMLCRRDNIHMAAALKPLTGHVLAHYVFGFGVVGMAISSIIILMLINGFCVCEMANRPSRGWLYRLGCLIPAVGVLGPFIWSGAAPYLAVPTSVSQFIVIPIAYTAFALVLNQRKLLGKDMPRGAGRWIWNLAMAFGVIAVTIGSVYMAHKKAGWWGIAGIAVFIGAVGVAHVLRRKKGKETLL